MHFNLANFLVLDYNRKFSEELLFIILKKQQNDIARKPPQQGAYSFQIKTDHFHESFQEQQQNAAYYKSG